MAKPPEAILERAARLALHRLEDRLGAVFDPVPDVRLLARDDFYARMEWTEERAVASISSGCIDAVRALWRDALQSNVLIDAEGRKIAAVGGEPVTEDRLVDLSLTWLILHELMHLRLGHLDILDAASLVECDADLPKRALESAADHWSAGLSEEERGLMRPCLELQADNDATEIMLGVYAESEWTRFRVEAAAIFVVMVLMEKAEADLRKGTRTYPHVATRFFTLFAQLFQYWLYADARLESRGGESVVRTARRMEGDEFRRYMKFVLALTLNDVIQIALWAGARSFLDDLRAGPAFFADLFAIQYAEDLAAADLKTRAAIEWRTLMPVNERIMTLSGLRA